MTTKFVKQTLHVGTLVALKIPFFNKHLLLQDHLQRYLRV